MTTDGKLYERFTPFHRVSHFLLIVSFFGLVLTGMPLAFQDQGWARWLYETMGGYPTAGYIHRICAGMTFLCAFMHFAYCSYLSFARGQAGNIIWGADAIMIQPKDVVDIVADLKWLLGFGPRPAFDRWIYWEKFEYLSLMWGTFVMALTGFMLWFPTTFSIVLPGWAMDMALIAHRYEAILAAVFVFTIHFIHTHLLPEKVPVDETMFTGVVSEEEMLHERPVHYKRLKEANLLEQYETQPNVPLSLISKIIAVPLLLIGLFLTSLMISSLLLSLI
ncbi:MAG: formate dehydrogenase subunit gamma [Candidatus Brocadiales bacterium]